MARGPLVVLPSRPMGSTRAVAALVLASLQVPALARAGDGIAPAVEPGDDAGGAGAVAAGTGADGELAGEADGAEPRLIPSVTGAQEVGSTRLGHRRQIGLAAQFVTGSRFIKTWDDADFCGERGESSTGNATYCTQRVPVSLDLTASYGLTARIELLFEMRVGLERDFGATSTSGNGPRLRHYAPGARFYFDDRGLLKFFSTAQVALDATGYQDAAGEDRGLDVALRNTNGLFLDFHDAYGAYAFFGEELEFKRWLEVGLEFGVGIQGRYP